MPTVPVTERQERLGGLPSVRAPEVPDTSTGYLRVAEQGIESAGRLQDIAQKQKQQVDKSVVLGTDTLLSKLKTDLEVKRNQLKGRNAAEALKVVEEEWQKGVESVSKELGNEDQKRAFESRVQHHWFGPGGLYESTLKYSDSELNKYTQQNFEAAVDLRIEDAIMKSDNEAVMNQSLAELEAIVKDHYDDPVVAADEYKDIIDSINKGVKELRIESERKAKEERELARQEANKDLTDMMIDDSLSYSQIQSRRNILSESDYTEWVNRYERDLEKKEKEAEKPKKLVDDPDIDADLSARAMTFPADADADALDAFRNEVAEKVLERKLKPATARSIISDAERTLTLDPARKSDEESIVTFLKNDYNNGLYGEPGTPEARSEYTRQLNAFRKWSRGNLDKDPVEYYEKVSDVPRKNFFQKVLGLGGPDITPQQRREELAGKRPVEKKEVIERRRAKDGRMMVKYADGTIGVE